MLFNSYVFIGIFLPSTLTGFFWSSRLGRRFAGGWLILASLTFYSWWNPAFLPLLLFSIGFNYTFSELISSSEIKPRLQKTLLLLAVGLNLGALFYFKYFYELIQFLATRAGLTLSVDPVVLPLGISFFTFTQIGYLIDVKQHAAKDRGFQNYLLFVTFFPHLIAGPILHNREMMPQFEEKSTYVFSWVNLSVGMTIFIIGLFKKTILADPLSGVVAAGFNNPDALSLVGSWRTVLTYSLQLYFDFSGYSDMAIGLARMFNVRFPLNFDSPLKSQNVIEYWQRWHMTLTRYLNLYLYNPIALGIVRWRAERGLGTKRSDHKKLGGFLSMIALPTFVTMTLIGLWHGAGFQFLFFGLLHAFYLIFNNAMRIFFPKKPGEQVDGWRLTARTIRNVLLTYVAVLVGMVFFRAPSLESVWSILGGMVGLHQNTAPYPISLAECLWMAVLYLIVWGLPNVQQVMANFEPAIGKAAPLRWVWMKWQMNVRWAIVAGATLALSMLAMGGTSEFLYFQF